MDAGFGLGYAATMKHHKAFFVAVLAVALAGCSGISIGIGLPIGGFGGVGVSVGSGGVVVGVGGTAQLPPRSPKSPDPIASAPGR